jgi:hypothetical protein
MEELDSAWAGMTNQGSFDGLMMLSYAMRFSLMGIQEKVRLATAL